MAGVAHYMAIFCPYTSTSSKPHNIVALFVFPLSPKPVCYCFRRWTQVITRVLSLHELNSSILRAALPGSFSGGDYSLDHHHQQFMKPRTGESSNDNNNNQIVDYLVNNTLPPPPQKQQLQHISSSGFCASTNSFDKLSFPDVMQFADFGTKLAFNQSKTAEEEAGIDPVFFLKFPVLNEKLQDDKADDDQSLMVHHQGNEERFKGVVMENTGRLMMEAEGEKEEVEARVNSEGTSIQIQFLGEDIRTQKSPVLVEGKNKRKRPRTTKTSEEVESQRMTHIAVERNRRKQMNEHLRVLRSLMPGSYVQRGDQASIIGGAIEFVRELEQLLQCLESQKRRRIYGDAPRPMGDASNGMQQAQQPFIVPGDPVKHVEFETGLREETAESKSCLADVEVKVLGFDAMIKILCRRRPGQLIKTIAALEELELNILHTNITTIEQTVLYSFNVKVSSESRFTADDIANSVQQIFSYIVI